MRRVMIVQARMDSTRLPGKVLIELEGRPMLSQQLRRLALCSSVDELVVATTTSQSDDAIVNLAEKEGVRWFRGSREDVLARYLGASRESGADVVVRVTADCPLIDPYIADRVIDELVNHAGECDYVSNVLKRTYPRGLDVEAMFRDTLERLNRLAQDSADREHVTRFLLVQRPDLFQVRSVTDGIDNSNLRWTVDTPDDLEAVRAIYRGLGLWERVLPYRETLAYVLASPEIPLINAHVQQKQN